MAKLRSRQTSIRAALRDGEEERVTRHWRTLFLDHLAETSNVTESAAKAGISPSRAYKIRREEPDFARAWLAALWEGYITGLANGANRMMIGSEAIQFVRAIPLGGRRWRLQGLLRGRGGTEPEAAIGHLAQTGVVLLDDSLVPLDAAEVPALDSISIAAIGTGDKEAVIADLANAGLSRRPLTPVHPRLQVGTDAVWDICWTRRARGQWRWNDGVDVPLIEELEAYLVGYGPIGAPYAAWSVDAPRIAFTQKQRAALVATWGPADLWVRQVGTFGQSPPLLIMPLS